MVDKRFLLLCIYQQYQPRPLINCISGRGSMSKCYTHWPPNILLGYLCSHFGAKLGQKMMPWGITSENPRECLEASCGLCLGMPQGIMRIMPGNASRHHADYAWECLKASCVVNVIMAPALFWILQVLYLYRSKQVKSLLWTHGAWLNFCRRRLTGLPLARLLSGLCIASLCLHPGVYNGQVSLSL